MKISRSLSLVGLGALLFVTSRALSSEDVSIHVTAFSVDGVDDTDGVDVVNVPVDGDFPLGLLVLQNGDAPAPADTSDINGFEYDGSAAQAEWCRHSARSARPGAARGRNTVRRRRARDRGRIQRPARVARPVPL